jgi:hypothetical protein
VPTIITRSSQPQHWRRSGQRSLDGTERELPIQSTLIIAFSLGLLAWYGIVKLIAWLSVALT